MKTTLSVYGVCDIGLKKPNNEDMVLLGDEIFRDGSRQKEFEDSKRLVIAVADGIGGLDKGEVASETVLTRLRDMLAKVPDDLTNDELKEVLDVYTKETHSMLLQGGSTLVAIFVYQGKVFRFHAGDSRIYLMRDGGLRRLTTDHSLRESGGDPNAPSNIITNSIGGGGTSFLEFAEIEQPFMNGDMYLLSSDGLHDIVSVSDIWDTLLLPETEGPPAEKLLVLAKEAGGKDNISIITIKVKEDEEQGAGSKNLTQDATKTQI
jgi:protein phosphatase